MSLISKMRKQAAVYWPISGRDDYGHPTWGDAVEIECRWTDVVQQFVRSDGEERFSRSVVYVDRDMKVGGVLLLGELDSGVDTADPKGNENAWEISRFDKTPNLRVTEYLRTVYL